MSKIPMIADVHLGVQGKLDDTMWALQVVRAYCAREGLTTILGLGDLYDNRESLALDVMCASHEYFEESRQKYDQHWIWIPGNHDMFLKHSWNINSLKPLSKIITLVDTVKIININDTRFWTLPFIHLETAFMRVLRKIEEQHEKDDVLLTHIGVLGAIKNTCFLLKDWSIVSFCNSKFDKVYSGHFHTYQQVNHNTWYPGSLIPFKLDEGDCGHGFIVYDTDTRTHEFIDIWKIADELVQQGLIEYRTPPPNYFTISDESIETSLEDVKELAKNNVIRIITDKNTSTLKQNDIKDMLISAGAKNIRWMTITQEEEHSKVTTINQNIDPFQMWLKADHKTIELNKLDVTILTNINNDIVIESDARYKYDQKD